MTLLDDGLLKIYNLVDMAAPGNKPDMKLSFRNDEYYSERSVGYNRNYTAMSVNQQIDMLVRIWQDKKLRTDMYVIPEDGEQYRISAIQHLKDDDGLDVSDLTLTRMEKCYELA